jgi:hypothetical protein
MDREKQKQKIVIMAEDDKTIARLTIFKLIINRDTSHLNNKIGRILYLNGMCPYLFQFLFISKKLYGYSL